MARNTAPLPVGARIAYLRDGYSLVPAVVIEIRQTDTGRWRGDINTQDGVLTDQPLHADFYIKQQHLQETNRFAWSGIWDELAKKVKEPSA